MPGSARRESPERFSSSWFWFDMRILFTVTAGILAAVQLSAAAQSGAGRASVIFTLPDGNAVLEWLSNSSFRFCRAWEGASCKLAGTAADNEIEVAEEDKRTHLEFRSGDLSVAVEKGSLRLRVASADGKQLLSDTSGISRGAGGISVKREAAEAERFYGLGARDGSVEIRGEVVEATKPFLISSLGYGLHHTSPGSYVFDLAASKPDSYEILIRGASWLEFQFYYGPTPKRILEKHREGAETPSAMRKWQFGILQRAQLPGTAAVLPEPSDGSWSSLQGSVRSMVNGALSAILIPAFDLSPYVSSDASVCRRAMQLGSIAPVLFMSDFVLFSPKRFPAFEAALRLRRRLAPYLLTYAEEARTTGIPMIHPLPVQFPKDAEAGHPDDEFMLGDEILAAPICTGASSRPVYLPMGFWTELKTNRSHKGRQTIEVKGNGDEIPLFMKNGSIVPFAASSESGPMELHYIPRLAAEFFLLEPERGAYTQFHAAPSGELIRLQIESVESRMYEWVVHHVPQPREVKSGGKLYKRAKELKDLQPGGWYYDPMAETIRIRARVAAGQDHVAYIGF